MLKEPRPGRVKTRLGRDIGMIDAAWWFRRQTCALIRRLRNPRWQIWLAVSPDTEGISSRIWPADLPRIAQGQGDLGQRMGRLFRSLPPGPVVIIGADIPGIERNNIRTAFCALQPSAGVIGPSPDGGYWLIGLKRSTAVSPVLFEGVRWSTEHARTDTLRTMPEDTALIDVLNDVDTVADLT
ncbi:MAG: glycosyltransferase [Rhodobacteraceae bacterium]|nr:glycosyltransferase [Paracoccaceae bacterium]